MNISLLPTLIAYESGELDEEETIDFFQQLIDNGLAWKLQGHYGRTAMSYIKAGLCVAKEESRG